MFEKRLRVNFDIRSRKSVFSVFWQPPVGCSAFERLGTGYALLFSYSLAPSL